MRVVHECEELKDVVGPHIDLGGESAVLDWLLGLVKHLE